MTKVKRKKLFHYAIVELIESCIYDQMSGIAYVLQHVQIPAGHDAIASAWKKQCKKCEWDYDAFGIAREMMRQKKLVQKKLIQRREGKTLKPYKYAYF